METDTLLVPKVKPARYTKIHLFVYFLFLAASVISLILLVFDQYKYSVLIETTGYQLNDQILINIPKNITFYPEYQDNPVSYQAKIYPNTTRDLVKWNPCLEVDYFYKDYNYTCNYFYPQSIYSKYYNPFIMYISILSFCIPIQFLVLYLYIKIK